MKVKEVFEYVKKLFEFLLLLPVYFIGVGVSKALRGFFQAKTPTEGWLECGSLKQEIESYEEMM